MTISDAAFRIAQIQSQISSLTGASRPPATLTGSAAAPPVTTGSASFASALSAAQGTPASAPGIGAAVDTGLAPAAGPVTLPAAASGQLTSAQQTFAARLAQQTGLDPGVISAWLLAEESGGAAQSRQAAGNNDWLNIGYTDSGTYGSSAAVWSDPTAAADATAGWLRGQNTIPGYGTASSGIQAILQTAGQPPAAQISALQSSGWASSGYPSLPTLYSQVAA